MDFDELEANDGKPEKCEPCSTGAGSPGANTNINYFGLDDENEPYDFYGFRRLPSAPGKFHMD